jgi:hypothetical protein
MKNPLKEVSGATLALTSLAVMGAAAVVSAPVWIWYRRKRKRTDSMASTAPSAARVETPAAETPDSPGDSAADIPTDERPSE